MRRVRRVRRTYHTNRAIQASNRFGIFLKDFSILRDKYRNLDRLSILAHRLSLSSKLGKKEEEKTHQSTPIYSSTSDLLVEVAFQRFAPMVPWFPSPPSLSLICFEALTVSTSQTVIIFIKWVYFSWQCLYFKRERVFNESGQSLSLSLLLESTCN